jgi:hypothetical protein
MATPEPNAPLCRQCRATMQHVRTIAHLNNLPEIHIFYCAPCQCVENGQAEEGGIAKSVGF